jgi:hypothetical protein
MSEHTPWCLLDEDIIHPKVKAETYQIDNQYVDSETGLVRIGFECVVDFQWNLYDIDVACENKDEIQRYDLNSYCGAHPERGAQQSNCVRGCVSPLNPDALYDTEDCDFTEPGNVCLNYQWASDCESTCSSFFPEFNGGCVYNPPDCYDLPFLKFDTTNHDICEGLPNLSKPGKNIDSLTETVNNVYGSLIERFGPQILEDGEMNPYPQNIIFISGVEDTSRYHKLWRWDSWNDPGYTGPKDCYGNEWELHNVIPMLDSTTPYHAFPGYEDHSDFNNDPRGLNPFPEQVSALLGEHIFYYKLKNKFIEEWGEEVANYKFNACPIGVNEENCFGHSCLESYGGKTGCYTTISSPDDPVPQNVSVDKFFNQYNHWPHFDADKPAEHPGDPWEDYYCSLVECGDDLLGGEFLNFRTCARGFPWNDSTFGGYAWSAQYSPSDGIQRDPCRVPIPWVNPHTWELEPAPGNYRENDTLVRGTADRDNILLVDVNETTKYMKNFTEIFKTKHRSPCYHTNIIEDEDVNICPCDEEKLYQANSFFIEKISPATYPHCAVSCEELNINLFIGGTGPNDFNIPPNWECDPLYYGYNVMDYCSGMAGGPIPANELGDDFRPDYTAYSTGNTDDIRGKVSAGINVNDHFVTFPLVCDQTGFPEYKLPTRYRNIYTHTGRCYCIDPACTDDDFDDDFCCNEPDNWHWDSEFFSELMDSCRSPFLATQSILWGYFFSLGSTQYYNDHYLEYISSAHHCIDRFGEDISATDAFPEYWWEPGMDLSSGNYPLTPHDFMSFDQCGRWTNAGQPPVPLDDTNVPNENCSDLDCWWISGADTYEDKGTLVFDECGCCSSTHENTDLSENCSYF